MSTGDVRISDAAPGVAVVEMNRPPNNFFDVPLVTAIADAYEQLAVDGSTRAIVLCSTGKNF